MNILTEYKRTYRKIAADHVRHWAETGDNPFQDPVVLKANEDTTFGNITRYVAEGSRVLDAGCGMGDLMLRLTEYETIGVEIAQPYLKVALERGLDVRPVRIEKLPFPNRYFDAVVASDVLEHVIDIHAATKEIHRVVRHGGYIITRVPNMEPVPWHAFGEYPFVHLRILDEGTMRHLLGTIFGCTIIETSVAHGALHVVARK